MTEPSLSQYIDESRRAYRSYRLTLAVVSVLVAFLVLLVVLLVERSAVLTLARMAVRGGHGPTPPLPADLIVRLLVVLVIPLASGGLTAILASHTINLTRLWLYRRAVHGYTYDYLEHYAPLHNLQIAPRVVAVSADGTPLAGTAVSLFEHVSAARTTLVIGATGQGKTAELHALAYELTRKRSLWRLYRGQAPLPVLLSLAAYAQSPVRGSGGFRLHSCLSQVQRWGTAGLSARLEEMMLSGSVMVLCDGLDEVPVSERLTIVQELAQMLSTYPGTSLVVTYDLQAYLDMPQTIVPLRQAARVLLSGTEPSVIAKALKRSHLASQISAPSLADDDLVAADPLRAHRLESSLKSPALLGALVELRESGARLPYGQAELLSANDALLTLREIGDGVQPERSLAILSALASSLRAAGTRTFPVRSLEHAGAGLVEWLAKNPPFSPLEYADSDPVHVTQEEADAICRGALMTGILAPRLDGQAVGFAHRLREASFVGRYLSLHDDHLGRLKPEVLRLVWALPMVLWAALTPDVSHLGMRVLALAETPDSTAARAGLQDREQVLARARALALGVVVEGAVPLFGRSSEHASSTSGAASPNDVVHDDVVHDDIVHDDSVHDEVAREATQLLLRDLVDAIQLEVTQHAAQRTRMADALTVVIRAAGNELLDDIAYLARLSSIDRLTRAQLIGVLGLVPTPDALNVLLTLLPESDPTLRQSLARALTLLGDPAIQALSQYLSADDERIRLHAQDIFVTLGSAAEAVASEMLASLDDDRRIAGARTLGRMQSSSAVEILLRTIDDREYRVQVAATEALGQIASPAAVTALLARVGSPAPDYRMVVASALGSSRQPEALPGLLRLLTDEVPQVRAAAAAALGLLGDMRARSPLQARHTDEDARVQSAAASALRRLTYS